MTRKPDDHILQPASLVQDQRLSSTSITVHTRKELRQAVKEKASAIVVDDPALARALERHLSKDSPSRVFFDPASPPVLAYGRLKKVSAWSAFQDALTPTRIVLALLAAVVLVFIPFAVFGNGVSSVVFGLLLVLVSVLSVVSVVLIAIDRGYDEIGVSYKQDKDSKTGQILLKRRSNSDGGN